MAFLSVLRRGAGFKKMVLGRGGGFGRIDYFRFANDFSAGNPYFCSPFWGAVGDDCGALWPGLDYPDHKFLLSSVG